MNAPFPPIFVISLSGAEERRSGMAEKLRSLGLDFEFFDAVDGRKTDVLAQPLYHARKRALYFGKHLTGGEWGCFLSHKALYEKICAENIARAIIFEDDAIPDDRFPEVLKTILQKEISFDVIRFMGSPKIERKGYRKITPLSEGFWLGRLPSVHGGAHAYMVSKEGAQKLLSYMARKKVAYPIDTILGRCWETGVNAYAVNPIVRQDLSLDSAIGEERFNKASDLRGLAKAVYPLTRSYYKIAEHVGKRRVFAASCRADKALGGAHE
ncbi:MAG: glycosyltransferase family 25 protein [Rhodospirillales bacterium]|nr:glycosyltransferase family 25 protein [Alphaproteobacteria bacterium]USO04327.1 MAG: glycosyltransferase family 25 protein [Rhodospirillales bacterium]